METTVSIEQVTAMAPDSASLAAGRKLAHAQQWQLLGRSPADKSSLPVDKSALYNNNQALWGECKGSAIYQVRVDLSTLATQCSCPSRKFPCKHCLGLLFLAAQAPNSIPEGDAPAWVLSWLAKREANQKAKETKALKEDKKPSNSVQKSAQKRLTQVTQGVEQLDLWLNDLVRHGLADLETQPSTFWEQQATQMVNAQAPGLATRLRAMAAIPNATADWTEKLLAQLGKLALLTEAFHHLDQLDPGLQEEVRQLIGWTVKEQDVLATGTQMSDTWLFLGQRTTGLDHGRSQRTWLLGTQSQQSALFLQFAMSGASFTESYPVGKSLQATLTYWPGAAPQRAIIRTRDEQAFAIHERLPGSDTFQTFLTSIATTLAANPWRDRFLCVVRDVVPFYQASSSSWFARDRDQYVLPLVEGRFYRPVEDVSTGGEHWQLLAIAGGHPVDFVGEWNGETLLPLGVFADGDYHLL